MKSSHKVLILSLSAVLVITGCERRGRAPIKASTSDGTSISSNTTGSLPVVAPSTLPVVAPSATPEKKVEISTVETQLVIDAQLVGCKDETISENSSATKASFLADLDMTNSFLNCMRSNGLVLVCSDETGADCEKSKSAVRNWTLDNSSDPEAKSSAYLAFAALAKAKNGTEDSAYKVMRSRLDLSIIRLGKMDTKYSEERMKSADFKATDDLLYSNAKITAGGTLADISKGVKALDDSHEAIKSMKVFVDGIDRTEAQAE
jgi:hypothetical protein